MLFGWLAGNGMLMEENVELTGQFKASPFNVPDSFLECEKEEL